MRAHQFILDFCLTASFRGSSKPFRSFGTKSSLRRWRADGNTFLILLISLAAAKNRKYFKPKVATNRLDCELPESRHHRGPRQFQRAGDIHRVKTTTAAMRVQWQFSSVICHVKRNKQCHVPRARQGHPSSGALVRPTPHLVTGCGPFGHDHES